MGMQGKHDREFVTVLLRLYDWTSGFKGNLHDLCFLFSDSGEDFGSVEKWWL